VYPGGQSGNPGSHYYNNTTKLWAKGNYIPFQFYQEPAKMKSVLATLTIKPE
jgi:penicillin amidase